MGFELITLQTKPADLSLSRSSDVDCLTLQILRSCFLKSNLNENKKFWKELIHLISLHTYFIDVTELNLT
jgi:hypothetical protein